jgi:hypothetical protein
MPDENETRRKEAKVFAERETSKGVVDKPTGEYWSPDDMVREDQLMRLEILNKPCSIDEFNERVLGDWRSEESLKDDDIKASLMEDSDASKSVELIEKEQQEKADRLRKALIQEKCAIDNDIINALKVRKEAEEVIGGLEADYPKMVLSKSQYKIYREFMQEESDILADLKWKEVKPTEDEEQVFVQESQRGHEKTIKKLLARVELLDNTLGLLLQFIKEMQKNFTDGPREENE